MWGISDALKGVLKGYNNESRVLSGGKKGTMSAREVITRRHGYAPFSSISPNIYVNDIAVSKAYAFLETSAKETTIKVRNGSTK